MSSASMTLPVHRATPDTYAGVAARQTHAARLTMLVTMVLVALQIAAIWSVVA
jgi:hypothetical protein